MTKNRITRNTGNSPLNQPSQGVARFNGDVRSASYGKSVTPLQPIKFTAGGEYMDQMNAIADLGVGIFNATAKVAAASVAAKEAERDAYLASMESDDIVQTNRIYNENTLVGNDPKELTTKLGEYKAGKMASMPEDVKAHYAQSFDKRAAVLTTRSQDAFFKKAKKDSGASLEASQEIIKEDIYKNPSPTTEIEAKHFEEKIAKYSATLQSRVAQGFLTPEEAELERRDFQKELITTGYKAQLQDMDANQRANAILALQETKTLPNGISVEDKADIVAKLNAYDSTIKSIETKATALKNADEELQTSREAADLEIGINRGETTYEDVVRAEQNKIITPAKKVQLFKQLDANLKKTVEESRSIQKVSRALRGEDFIDPKSTDDKKAVDLTYEKVLMPKIDAAQDPAAKKQIITNFVDKMGIVPEKLRGKMRGVFRGDDVEQKVFYADLVGRIQDTKPQALDDFDTKDITQAIMINEMVEAGTPNEQAVEKVQNLTEGINAGRLEILREDFKNLVEDKGTGVKINSQKVINTVQDTFDEGVFSMNASLPQQQLGVEAAAINDYKKLYETWYLNTNGDAELAKKQAQKALKRTWGTTNVNGTSKQLTKYPIEDAYAGMSSKDIKKELMDDVRAIDAYKDLEDDEVIIQWDQRTAREYGQYPTYQVLVFNKDGVLEPVADETLQRWKPDYAGFQKKRKAAIFKEVKEERGARDINNIDTAY